MYIVVKSENQKRPIIQTHQKSLFARKSMIICFTDPSVSGITAGESLRPDNLGTLARVDLDIGVVRETANANTVT